MLRFLSDENFNGDMVRGLLLRQPNLELVRVQDVGLLGADDPAVLDWPAENDRILLTHDRATMPDFAADRVACGHTMPGVVIVPVEMPIRRAIEEIELLATCGEATDWDRIILYLPL